jgi:hypothetical protein
MRTVTTLFAAAGAKAAIQKRVFDGTVTVETFEKPGKPLLYEAALTTRRANGTKCWSTSTVFHASARDRPRRRY